MDVDGGNQRNLTRHPAFDVNPDWSPDGKQIAFTSDWDGGNTHDPNIYVIDASGDNVRQLTHLEFAVSPKWSPDGKYIAFQGIIDQGRQIYVMNANGTNLWQVSKPVPDALMFLYNGWSPDGKQILYVEVINALGTDATVIIATLSPIGRVVIRHERVPLAKMALNTAAWGVDGKSIIALRKEGE